MTNSQDKQTTRDSSVGRAGDCSRLVHEVDISRTPVRGTTVNFALAVGKYW